MHFINKISYFFIFLIIIIIFTMPIYADTYDNNIVYISESQIIDKIKGSLIGQMAGVSWGAPTEFLYQESLIPDNDIPLWTPDMINNSFSQDDIYVEIPFINTLKEKGLYAGWKAFGDSFRKTDFWLCHANDTGRTNLICGADVPYSGHYLFNNNCDDIDWQIESDFIGTIFPGQVNKSICLSWKAGHVMNYGDGVYGGVFVSAMHSKAFTAVSIDEIINTGVSSVPKGSQYRAVLDDVLSWKAQGKTWEENWNLVNTKWSDTDRCSDGLNNPFNIDAKINGAYVLIGLLYGNGDFEKSMRVAMRCGQDSDCNPSTVGGIIGNWIGAENIPDKWKSALNETEIKFYGTDYNFNQTVNLVFELAKQSLKMSDYNFSNGVWQIKNDTISPPILEQWPKSRNTKPYLNASIDGKGLTIDLRAFAKDSNGISGYQWFFGDLSYSNGAKVSHTYSTPGTYEIICYTADKAGNTEFKGFNVQCFEDISVPVIVTPIEYKTPTSPYVMEKPEPKTSSLLNYLEKLRLIFQSTPMMGR